MCCTQPKLLEAIQSLISIQIWIKWQEHGRLQISFLHKMRSEIEQKKGKQQQLEQDSNTICRTEKCFATHSTYLVCFFKWSRRPNRLPHVWHGNGRWPVWMRLCRVNSSLRVNVLPQFGSSHLNGPAWVDMQIENRKRQQLKDKFNAILISFIKVFACRQIYLRSPVWIRMWPFNCPLLENATSQCGHLNFFGRCFRAVIAFTWASSARTRAYSCSMVNGSTGTNGMPGNVFSKSWYEGGGTIVFCDAKNCEAAKKSLTVADGIVIVKSWSILAGDTNGIGDRLFVFIVSFVITLSLIGVIGTRIESFFGFSGDSESTGNDADDDDECDGGGVVVDVIVLSCCVFPSHGRNRREYVCGGGKFTHFNDIIFDLDAQKHNANHWLRAEIPIKWRDKNEKINKHFLKSGSLRCLRTRHTKSTNSISFGKDHF